MSIEMERYRKPEIVESKSATEQDVFNVVNVHFVQPSESTTYINVFPRIIKRLDEDLNDLVITSAAETLHTPGTTKFILRSPVMWYEDQEMPYVYDRERERERELYNPSVRKMFTEN
jgi:hypothetical protein